ncbi:MAG: hypothetical protein ACYC0V_04615 [Armatimonadota bacterium]
MQHAELMFIYTGLAIFCAVTTIILAFNWRRRVIPILRCRDESARHTLRGWSMFVFLILVFASDWAIVTIRINHLTEQYIKLYLDMLTPIAMGCFLYYLSTAMRES